MFHDMLFPLQAPEHQASSCFVRARHSTSINGRIVDVDCRRHVITTSSLGALRSRSVPHACRRVGTQMRWGKIKFRECSGSILQNKRCLRSRYSKYFTSLLVPFCNLVLSDRRDRHVQKLATSRRLSLCVICLTTISQCEMEGFAF